MSSGVWTTTSDYSHRDSTANSSRSFSSISPTEHQSFLSSSAPVVDSFMQFDDEDDVADDDVCMEEVEWTGPMPAGDYYLFIYLFVSGNKAHKHHKHEQKKTDRNTDMQIDRH